MSKVCVALDGGLGNQMFQYAAGRALALRTRATLALDLRGIIRRGQRPYGLGDFVLGEATELIVEGAPPRRGRLARLLARLSGAPPSFREAGFAYDERSEGLGAPVRLEGYFQSERYFAAAAETIRADFTARAGLRGEVDALAGSLLPAGPSISLHVRRGDYTDPAVMKVHGLMGADYYERALRALADRTGPATVCVFTDDPAWVRAHLRLPPDTRFVSEHTRSALQDLIIMSRCSHHVTANSSFSWWGAWLNPSPGKIVVTPERWFQPVAGLDTRDLRPAGWLRL